MDQADVLAVAKAWADPGAIAALDPARMADPVCAAIARMLRDQWSHDAIGKVFPDVGPMLAAVDPDGRPAHPGSTWADLAAILGPLRWEWAKRIPRGMLTMVVAEQGRGKSCFCLRLAACYLRGDPWPDGSAFEGERGRVLWCEAEASQGLNFDRASVWGLPVADLVSPLEDPLDEVMLQNADHQAAIEEWAHNPEIRLVILDSLSGANTAKENDAAMAHVTKWLASLATATGKPIVLTHHLRKKGMLDLGDRVTLDRIRGSGAIIQAARSVLAIDAPDPARPEVLRLSTTKNNIVGPQNAGPSLGMAIGGEGVTFTDDAPEAPKDETLQDKASDLLLALLQREPVQASELKKEVEGAGLSWDAANKAKRALKIVSQRKDGVWWWSLPAHVGDGEK